MTYMESRSEHLSSADPSKGTCLHCGVSLAHRKDGAQYCHNACKRAAFDERARDGRVASARRLKSGKMSVVVHMDDVGLKPGDPVRVG